MRQILLNMIKETIEKWNIADIYAVSLFVYDENDNPSRPTVTLGYNTEQYLQDSIEDAENEREARWNYAYWPQNEELVFGIGRTRKYVKEWLKENNFPDISNKEIENMDFNKIDKFYFITQKFVDLLVSIVQELHSSGFIRNKFKKDIPILIHELEYYDTIAEQNLRANPADTVADFVRFCKEG